MDSRVADPSRSSHLGRLHLRSEMARGALARRRVEAMRDAAVAVETLEQRTKIPRSIIRGLLDEQISAVTPERVYLRGHASTLARVMGVDVPEMRALFDAAYPEAADLRAPDLDARFGRVPMAVAAGLGGIAVLAVILAFAR